MNINLKKLRLRNFKGIKNLEINFGKVTNIYGENATGKTTVFDAFTWLLFDKDSTDRKDFGIKTYDSNGEVFHGLDHEVEGVLEVDGAELILKKIYKEKWTKRRGEAERQLTGHTTDYYIDDVPVKKKEYTERINELIDEGIFKLITNPLYFNTVLNWKDRRNILLEVVGDISDQDVMATSNKLKRLENLLGDKSLEDFKKMISSKKKKLNEELKSIPYRIDELNNSIEEVEDTETESIEFRIRALKGSINEIDNQILDHSKIYEKNSKIKAEIYKLKDKLRDIEQEQRQKAQEPKIKLQQVIFGFKNQLKELEYQIQSKKEDLEKVENEIPKLEEKVQELREKWFEEDKKTFEFDESQCICPTCGQELPKYTIESKKAEMEKNFKMQKESTLQSITAAGKSYSEKIKAKKEIIKKIENAIETFESDRENLLKDINQAEEKYQNLSVSEFVPTDEYKQIELEIKELESKIVKPDETTINELKNKKAELENEIDRLKYSIRAKEHNEKAKNRIMELQERERELANQIAELEGQEYLCEEFVRTKVDLLESRINKKFRNVRFKLFNTLVNGAIEECCETLIDGVPYSDANNAAKINAGLDIINTLTKHYNVSAPVFIDNRESINELIDCGSQIVNLIVSKDKKLKVEVQKENKVEVA